MFGVERSVFKRAESVMGVDKVFYCALFGDRSVGKTSYVERLKRGTGYRDVVQTFVPEVIPFDFVTSSNLQILFCVLDLPGIPYRDDVQPFGEMNSEQCVIFMVDPTVPKSQDQLYRLWDDMEKKGKKMVPSVLVATKEDVPLTQNRKPLDITFHKDKDIPLLSLSSKRRGVRDEVLFQPFLLLARMLLQDESLDFFEYPISLLSYNRQASVSSLAGPAYLPILPHFAPFYGPLSAAHVPDDYRNPAPPSVDCGYKNSLPGAAHTEWNLYRGALPEKTKSVSESPKIKVDAMEVPQPLPNPELGDEMAARLSQALSISHSEKRDTPLLSPTKSLGDREGVLSSHHRSP